MGFAAGGCLIISLSIMTGLAYIGSGFHSGGNSAVTFSNPNLPPPGISGNSITYYCGGDLGNLPITAIKVLGNTAFVCQVTTRCTPALPLPVYCLNASPQNPVGQYLNYGQSVTAPISDVTAAGGLAAQNGLSASKADFFFGLGGVGFIALLVVAVSLVGLAGPQIFGTGFNMESIHILFVMGLLLGIWGLLGSLDGFLAVPQRDTSFFVELNGLVKDLGTDFFIILTLIYALGGIGTVSRGG